MPYAPSIPSSTSFASSSFPCKFYTNVLVRETSKTYDQVLVSIDKGLVTELLLEIDSKCFDPVAHAVTGRNTRQVLQKVRESSLFRCLLEVFVVGVMIFLEF